MKTERSVPRALHAFRGARALCDRCHQPRGAPIHELRRNPKRGMPSARAALSPREQEVGALLVRGGSSLAIAQRLGISQHTVKKHVHAIFRKLGIGSRSATKVSIATIQRLMAQAAERPRLKRRSTVNWRDA
jgi:DNA-binding CsgD family transcriptional regulator